MSNTSVNNEFIDFMKMEHYDGSTTKLIAFSNGGFEFNGSSIGFSNMTTYPINFKGHPFNSPETAYIACFYGKNDPKCIEIQREIQQCTNGLFCKRKFRGKELSETYGRKDFHQSDWHFNLMLYLVWKKCKTHRDFARLLLNVPDKYVIIENQNPFAKVRVGDWGCKNYDALKAYKQKVKELEQTMNASKLKIKEAATIATWNEGVWEGRNHQGKILMACRTALRTKTTPPINIKALNDAKIYLLGELLEF